VTAPHRAVRDPPLDPCPCTSQALASPCSMQAQSAQLSQRAHGAPLAGPGFILGSRCSGPVERPCPCCFKLWRSTAIGSGTSRLVRGDQGGGREGKERAPQDHPLTLGQKRRSSSGALSSSQIPVPAPEPLAPRLNPCPLLSPNSQALCAGGDVKWVVQEAGRGNQDTPSDFFRTEYALNLQIARFPLPYIALMDGVVMGGGAGVSVHGHFRVVTER
jgi:hypothetical protein